MRADLDFASGQPTGTAEVEECRRKHFGTTYFIIGRRAGGADGARRRGGDVRERRLAKFRQNVARFRLYRLRFC